LMFWLTNREPSHVPLKYGEFVQVLQASRHDPNVVVQRVRVGRSDIRGEITVTDSVSGLPSDKGDKHTQTVPFRVLRLGLEDDAKLHELLRETVGPAYQGEEEESALKGFYSILSMLFFLAIGLVLVMLVFRWIGGAGPLSFGRSKAKVAAEKDLEYTF